MASDQFGYSTTLLKYCQYSASIFDITYIGWDYNAPKIEVDGVKVKYVSRKSHLIIRNFRLLNAFHKEINKGYDIVFTTYFRGISLVRLLNPKSNMLIYVDTLGVMFNQTKRNIYDFVLKQELLFFNQVAVISEGLAHRMNLNRYEILPIGGECFSRNSKSFDEINLLYVGTLENRNILDCVKGFHRYIKNYRQKEIEISARFAIVGDSPDRELVEIKKYIQVNSLEAYINTAGYIHQNALKPFFENYNIGVSYIPNRSYYQYQPPTKTYEYLISGLPVIATSTYENKNIVKPGLGVIIEDTAESFFEGILKINEQKSAFNSDIIRNKCSDYKWQSVVTNKFVPLIQKMVQ